ncbi:MAG: hypothetical protein JXA82_18165 [Sedimentisphaerales bacterium]|nr:hypothetical protein [Sedimentisphaerales bacterium]
MPRCGSQVILCDIPVRFDTYKGCSHACRYCFAARKQNLADIGPNEGIKALSDFIKGRRTVETNWCDWNIPLHWGGLSDPFQPIEAKVRLSFKALELFAQTQYPFVFSTKGRLVGEPEYLDLIGQCNCAGQISLLTEQAEQFEPGAPSFKERLHIAERLAPKVKRLIIRAQPYMPQYKEQIIKQLGGYKSIGVYGIILEGLKHPKCKAPCTEKLGADYVIPLSVLRPQVTEIKQACHELGLKFFCGENRLRGLSDSLCCCGVEDIPGWQVNTANLNHIYYGQAQFTEQMSRPRTGTAFKTLRQTTIEGGRLARSSYKANMLAYAKSRVGRTIYGI